MTSPEPLPPLPPPRPERLRPWLRPWIRPWLLGAIAVAVATAALGAFLSRDTGDPLAETREEILEAIRLVESGGDDACPDGDGGLAIGPFQIHRVYWEDAIAFDPTLGGRYEHCRRRDYAERVVEAYMNRYVAEAWERADAEVIARTHNGGPRGNEKAETLEYWGRVDGALERVRAAAP